MDLQAISLVRSSFKAIAAVPDGPQTLSRSFYALLFARYPEARDFFPAAMDEQRDRLISAVKYVIERLEEDSGQILVYLAQLGRDHRKYGIEDKHFAQSNGSANASSIEVDVVVTCCSSLQDRRLLPPDRSRSGPLSARMIR